MDIGDVNEIPTTRKKLPSMQELGAFDFEAPTAPRPSVVAMATAGAAAAPALNAAAAAVQPRRPPLPASSPPATPPMPEAPAHPRATSEQIRAALAKADPQTRKRLLRLIAGGQSVQQRGDQQQAPGNKSQPPLVMALKRNQRSAPTPPPAAAPAGNRRAEKTAASAGAGNAARRRDRFGNTEKPLMQIDGNTDLLDAVVPALDADEKKAALLAQLAAASIDDERPAGRTAAHKVLFPAYDPQQHGDHVRRPGRKADAPVEGHFPAPRQIFQASYRHADGRPMDEEETRVEEVLQEQRCERTLEVLARDGVNGLLLSPRDLDAAVENGVLDANTADLLWKTWSALRPVIHVIEDPLPAPTAFDPGVAAVTEGVPGEPLLAAEDSGESKLPNAGADDSAPTAADTIAQPPAAPPTEPDDIPPPVAPVQTADSPTNAMVIAAPAAMVTAVPEALTLAAPDAETEIKAGGASEKQAGTRMVGENTAPFSQRLANGSRRLGRAFVIGCVISSSVQLGWLAWWYGGQWLP